MSVTSRRRNSYRRDSRRRSYGTRRTAGSGEINVLARFGLVARGIIYVVIGAIALMLALGAARHAPDRTGALEAIASKPFGYILLWVVTIGFGGLALWKIVQAAVARLNPTKAHRLRAIGSAIGYTIACVTTYWFVRFGRVPASSDTTSRDLTATVMSHSGGPFLVLLAGVIAVVAGIYMVIEALRLEFTRYLRMGWMSRRTQDTVVTLGRFGYAARGVIVFLIGLTLIDAAASYNPAKATGVDGALRTIAGWPFGPVLLILVALGLIAFGVLSFLEAKWRRTYGGVPV